MDWQKLFSDLSLTTEKPMDQSLIYFAMLIDLYGKTNNPDVKAAIERNFIVMLKLPPQ